MGDDAAFEPVERVLELVALRRSLKRNRDPPVAAHRRDAQCSSKRNKELEEPWKDMDAFVGVPEVWRAGQIGKTIVLSA